jgi:hypothetical protein cdiviTM7_01257
MANMEKISKSEVKTQDTQDAYEGYLTRVSDNLFTDPDHPEREPRSRSIVYVPYRGFSEQLQQDCPNIIFTNRDSSEVDEAVREADVIINIARGEEVVKEEIGHPDRNVKLPPESLANTEMVGDLYLQAIEKGNTDVQVVHTGRMNNKTIAMATAMPILAEAAGLNEEDVIHTPDAQIHRLVENNHIDIKELMDLVDTDPKMQAMQVGVRALRRIYKARGVDPDIASSSELTNALLDEYEKYPRISTSTLMKEQMLQNVAEKLRSEGKSEKEINEVVRKLDEFTDEEPDSVDTVTNFTNSIPIILSKQLIKEGYDADEVGLMSTEQKMELLAGTEMTVAIVADIAHMPRVMWLADYLMPDNFKLVFVESRTGLDEETLQKSMEREERSLKLTRNWLTNQMGTRNPAKVSKLADEAYWGKDSISNEEINARIQQAK